jgi:signal transduction histidine kinase/ActR/RegA family two-component response regulator
MALGAELVGQLDHLGDWGVLATDAHLIVTGWNRWLVQRTGRPAAAVLGRSLFELYPDLAERNLDRYYQQALAGLPVILSQRLHRYVLPFPPSIVGTGLPYMQQSVRIIPIVDGPKAGGTITLIEDVTERVTYEAELRLRARRQAAIAAITRSALAGSELDEIARAVVACLRDAMSTVEFIEILEWAPDRAAWIMVAGSGWRKPAAHYFEANSAVRGRLMLSASRPIAVKDALIDGSLGRDEHLSSHGVRSGLMVRIPDSADRLFGLLGVYTRDGHELAADEIELVRALADVLGVAIERKRLEGELRLRVGELALADRRKDEFLAMLAHELRNPLAPVRNGLQILRLSRDKPELAAQVYETIDRQVQHLSRLVDDLLDISRITRGKVQLRNQRVNLAEIIESATEEVRPLIDRRRHRLTISRRSGPVWVLGDPVRLVQVVANLLNNAAKYMDEGGEILLTVGHDGEFASLQIRDQGIGISSEMLDRVFDLFAQVDDRVDRSQGGLGIGLTLVRTLIELHGGRVTVHSAGIGKGSEFAVHLPLQTPPAAINPEDQADVVSIVPRRVLIVDDNNDSADTLAMLLQLQGHDVAVAYNGHKAIEKAREFRPELILLDIGLPGMSGYEVAPALRAVHGVAGATIIAMTGYGQESDRLRTQAAGFDHHLVKPVDPHELARMMAIEYPAQSPRE